jgi:hypothetical protein
VRRPGGALLELTIYMPMEDSWCVRWAKAAPGRRTPRSCVLMSAVCELWQCGLLDPDVAQIFTDSESVNQALRALAEIIQHQSGKTHH